MSWISGCGKEKNENTKNRGKETHLTLKIDSGGTREIAFIIRLLQGRRWLGAHHKERRRSQSQPTEAQQARRHRPCKGSTLGKVREGERRQTEGESENAERSMPRRLEKSLVVVSGGSFSGRERKEREEGRHSVTSLVTAESVKSGSSECGNSRSIDLVCFVLLFAYEKQLLLLSLSHPFDIIRL